MESNKLDEWFEFEVLPLEAALIRFLRRNRRQEDDVADLLQEVYVRLYESAAKRMPDMVKPFVFATARNLLIDLARRAQVVSIEAYADLDILDVSSDELTPERHATGHQELRLLQQAMDMLPARCREVVQLRKIDDMSQRDVALYMGITEDTVEKQISKGMRVLASSLLVKGVTVGVTKLSLKIRKKDDSV